MNERLPAPADIELLDAARFGQEAAWEELERRHGPAVRGVAQARGRVGARRAAQRALEGMREAVARGETIEGAVRPSVLSRLTGGSVGPGPEDDPFGDLVSLARAFTALPELWQTVLWHRLVEQQPVAEVATVAGRSAKDTAALLLRAEDGLFEAYLQDRLTGSDADSIDEPCRPIVSVLGAASRSTLSAHQQRVVDDHLTARPPIGDGPAGCPDCRRRRAMRDEIPAVLATALVPGLVGMPVGRYRAAAGASMPPAGMASVDERRVDRQRRLATVGAIGAAALAVVAGLVLVRDDFDVSSLPGLLNGSSDDDPSPMDDEPGAASASTTTTTELTLRPALTGPANEIELVFTEGTRPVGFAPAPSDIVVAVTAPAPVFAGGTGTIDVVVGNTGGTAVAGNFEMAVPPGIEFDALVEGPAECADPEDAAAFCNVTVPAASEVVVTLRYTLTSSTVGRFVVSTNTGAEPLEVQIRALSRLLHTSVGRGDVLMIGNTVLSCADSDENCAGARDGSGEVLDRWDLPMASFGAVPELGLQNSSVATLVTDAPSIERAYLMWSGDLAERNVTIVDDGRSARVRMVPPVGDPVDVEAQRIRLGDFDATQYLGIADVTDVVRAAGAGDYRVGNIQSVEVQGSYAGWSLVVITSDEAAARRQFVVTTPFTWFSPDDVFAAPMPVVEGEGLTAALRVLAFEGERTFQPERFVVGGAQLGSDSVFDSTIVGPRDPAFDNNLGMDIESYDLVIDAPDGTLAFEATSQKDGVRLAVFALSVDVP